MPVYRITTRDGRQFDVTLREGITPDQAMPQIQQALSGVALPTPEPKAPSIEDTNIFRDVPGALISGVGSLVGLPAQVYGLATGDFDTTLGEISGDISKFGQELKSPGLRERERLAGEAIEKAAGKGTVEEVGTALSTYLGDPRLLLSGVLETAPSLVGSLGAGTIARGGVRAAMRAAGKELGEEAAKKAAVSGAVGFGATQQGADVGAQTYIQAMETPDQVWAANPQFNQRIATGEDPNAVKADMALSAARNAALTSGAISLGTAALLPGVEKFVLGEGVSGGLLSRAFKGGAGEAFQEGLEEGGGQYAQNVGMAQIEPGTDAMRGVAGAATVGAILGGGMGAPVAALNRAPELGELPGAGTPPPPGAPATPPSEGLLGLLGQPGGKVFIDEGGTEVPYIFRGIDDTGRVMLEDDAGNQYLEDPKDLEGALTRNEPPVGAPPAPPAAPPAPPAGVPPVTPPAAPPIGVPPTATPPVTPPAATPPAAPPAATPPAGIPITPPTGVPAPPSPPAPPPPGAPSPVPGGPPPTPPVEEPTDKPFTPFQPPEQPTIADEETRKYWKGNLNRQRSVLLNQRSNLIQSLNAFEPEDAASKQAVSDKIDELDTQIGEIDTDLDGLDQGVAPVPRARPLDDMTAKIADAADVPLENAVRNLPATGVMDWFAQNATTDFHRALAKRIGNMMRAMEGAGFQFNWGVYDQNFKPRDAGEKRNYDYVMNDAGTLGAAWTHSQAMPGYSTPEGGFNKVDIGVKGASLSNSGSNEVTILHEFSHAVTVAAIQALRSKKLSPNSRVGKAIKDLQRLKVSAVKHKNKILKDIQDGKDVDPRLAQAVRTLERSNAWKNEKELIVQGLSNIDMQIVLKSLPYKETNGFVEFIRQIGRLIGVSEKDMNGLRRLFELTDVLIPTDTTQQQEVLQAMTKPKTVSGAPTPATEAVPTAPQAQAEEELLLENEVQDAIEEARKVPSLSRRVDRLVREWRAGRITNEEFMSDVAGWADYIREAREGKRLKRLEKPRARGADYVRQRLLEAKRRGDITEEAVDFAEWFILRNPALVDELGISMRTPKRGERFTGTYTPASRLMTLLKGSSSDTTAVHEILHHLERMMPQDVQKAIRDSWWKSTQKAMKAETKAPAKNFFAAIKSFYTDSPLVDAEGRPFTDENGRPLPPSKGMEVAYEIYNRDLGYDYYQHINPSEFWAVNSTDIMKGRFDVQGTILGRLKGWLRDAGQYIKGFFGLPSSAPILKALKSLSDADGKFVSREMLAKEGMKVADAQAPEVPSVPATELVVPEEAANAITSDAATASEKDTKKMIADAAKPIIKLYDMRSELQEKNRGCD